MVTLQLPLERPTVRMNLNIPNRIPAVQSATKGGDRDKGISGTPVLVMAAYFLVLGSVAVVVLSGQFPWFTLAPITVFLMISHFRRVEARLRRQSSGAH